MKRGMLVNANTFFGKSIQIVLPAGTDIFLTKGKSHSSEIRLAKFIIKNLHEGNHFVDIGAHFGYFSLLASELVRNSGKVLSIEASNSIFEILMQNVTHSPNITPLNAAISDQPGMVSFYEFPVQFSEYNALDIHQYENKKWFRKNPPKKYNVQAMTVDEILAQYALHPAIIKIDVEGAELKVIRGSINALKNTSPIIVMEYLEESRHNEAHVESVKQLRSLGYQSFSINNDGELEPCDNIDEYLSHNGYDSDNIAFLKINRKLS
jgi:FkbM family methyltransferase